MKPITEEELKDYETQKREEASHLVRVKMKENNMTPYLVAKKSGVSYHAVNRVIDKKEVKSSTLTRIIRALGGNMLFM